MTTQQLIKRGLTICSNLAHSCYPHHCQQLMGEKMIAFSGKAQTLWIPLTSWQLTKQVLLSVIRDEVHICYLYLQPHFSEGWGVAILREGSARHYLTINIFSTDESCLVIRDEAHTCCFCIWPHFSDWCGIAVLRERGCEKCTFAASTFYPTLVLGEKLQFWEFVTHTCQLRSWSNLQWCVKNCNSGEVTGMAPLIPMTQWRLLGEIITVHGRWCT